MLVADRTAAPRRDVTEGRGSDIVIEAVGRPQAWQWAVDMVRRGGLVNFFGGCATGTRVELDTNRLHYSELTLKAIDCKLTRGYSHHPGIVDQQIERCPRKTLDIARRECTH